MPDLLLRRFHFRALKIRIRVSLLFLRNLNESVPCNQALKIKAIMKVDR